MGKHKKRKFHYKHRHQKKKWVTKKKLREIKLQGRKWRKQQKKKQKPLNLNDSKTKRVIWEVARYLTSLPRDDRNTNRLSYCPVCEHFYCQGFTFIDSYCYKCFYRHGCEKVFFEERICQQCSKQ